MGITQFYIRRRRREKIGTSLVVVSGARYAGGRRAQSPGVTDEGLAQAFCKSSEADLKIPHAAEVKANAAMLTVLIPQCLAQNPGTRAHLALAQSILKYGGPDFRPPGAAFPAAAGATPRPAPPASEHDLRDDARTQ